MSSIISIKNLHKAFFNKKVLHGIDLEIAAGQIIGYIGPNGAGKSTTIRILAGLDRQFRGEVTVMGYNVKEEPLEVKKRIGYIPEAAEIYEVLTPLEFYELVGGLQDLEWETTRKRAKRLEEYLQLSYAKDQRIDTFSKGMKQKVLLISGLLHDPDLIFLDEPLAGLDANSVIRVKELLQRLTERGKTIFYSSHIMEVVEKISDRIILLNNGKIAANGTFEEINRQARSGSLENLFATLTGATSEALGDFDFTADE
ncbi:ABC transporter ATP-binding protein [Lewinella sp. W8]|uniref:ABC transporter ATP-binding protein n=1 Tax=Lewinella sp. W8 TaxID=2528208 RepID=UPI001068C064|nr:ABC transporter ATP-binding protein [Lewinella sp. W8]MTB53543.1 ATP-binding cassette domain-containing protein [Lewinella sp. W8]